MPGGCALAAVLCDDLAVRRRVQQGPLRIGGRHPAPAPNRADAPSPPPRLVAASTLGAAGRRLRRAARRRPRAVVRRLRRAARSPDPRTRLRSAAGVDPAAHPAALRCAAAIRCRRRGRPARRRSAPVPAHASATSSAPAPSAPYDGALRAIVHALKYDGRRSLARPLGGLMRERGAELLAGADCAVPVPLHRSRRRRRGFNQADDLARHLGLPVVPALRRVRATPPQAELPAARRHGNVRGAFAPARAHRRAAAAPRSCWSTM